MEGIAWREQFEICSLRSVGDHVRGELKPKMKPVSENSEDLSPNLKPKNEAISDHSEDLSLNLKSKMKPDSTKF